MHRSLPEALLDQDDIPGRRPLRIGVGPARLNRVGWDYAVAVVEQPPPFSGRQVKKIDAVAMGEGDIAPVGTQVGPSRICRLDGCYIGCLAGAEVTRFQSEDVTRLSSRNIIEDGRLIPLSEPDEGCENISRGQLNYI